MSSDDIGSLCTHQHPTPPDEKMGGDGMQRGVVDGLWVNGWGLVMGVSFKGWGEMGCREEWWMGWGSMGGDWLWGGPSRGGGRWGEMV